jgi:hypothetical protein
VARHSRQSREIVVARRQRQQRDGLAGKHSLSGARDGARKIGAPVML